MTRIKRRHLNSEEKFTIVKPVLGKAGTVTEINEECGAHMNQNYRRQAEFLDIDAGYWMLRAGSGIVPATVLENAKGV